jgi:signal transduction histidine kinase
MTETYPDPDRSRGAGTPAPTRLPAGVADPDDANLELLRAHQRERLLNTLLRISMEEIPLDEQLERALDVILSMPWLPAAREGAILLREEGADALELRAYRGGQPELRSACARVQFGVCLCGRAAASGQAVFADSLDERHELHPPGMAPHANFCVPVWAAGRVVATLVLYYEAGHRADADHEAFLQAIAHTLGGLIQRKRSEALRDATLLELRRSEQQLRELNEQLADYGRNLELKVDARTHEVERRRQVAASLRDMLAVLNSARPVEEILDHIAVEAGQLLDSDTSAIYRLEGPGLALRVLTARGAYAGQVTAESLPRELAQALLEGRPWSVPDLSAAPSEDLAACSRALLAVPLRVAGELYGGLVLFYSEARPFTGDDVNLAVAFADQAALAVENARLHEQAQQAAVLGERSRLARELHDSVTQSLYSLTLLAEGWRRLEAAGRLEDRQAPLAEMGAIAQQALKEMRLLVHELRPPDLEKVGLLGALHQRLGAVEKRAGVEARLLADDLAPLPPGLEEGLYRIAIEALNNALKHAEAASVEVHLHTQAGRLVLEVKDDGRGFDPATLARRRGLGVPGMRERAERLGGTLTLDSAPGRGTVVKVEVGPTGGRQGPP